MSAEESRRSERRARAAAIRLELGCELRRLRVERDLSGAELARQAELTSSTISKIEHGVIGPTVATVRALCVALDLSDLDADRLVRLARTLRGQSSESDVPVGRIEQIRSWRSLFERANKIRVHSLFLPALFQLPAMVSAVGRHEGPEVEAALQQARLACQATLWDVHRRFELTFSETGLRSMPLMPTAFDAQLAHLESMMARDNIDVHIVPASSTLLGNDPVEFDVHSFTIFDDSTVLVDVDDDIIVVSDSHKIRRYEWMFHRTRERAISGNDAIALVRSMMSACGTAVDLRSHHVFGDHVASTS